MKGREKGQDHLILQKFDSDYDEETGEIDNTGFQGSQSATDNLNNNGNLNNNANANSLSPNKKEPKDGAGTATPVGSSPRPSMSLAIPNPHQLSPAAANGPTTPTTPITPQPSINVEGVEGETSPWAHEEADLGPYRFFTPASYTKLLIKEASEKKRVEEKKNNIQEGKLVDGELKFGDGEEDEEEQKEFDPALENGSYLSEDTYGDVPNECLGKPLEEIDKYLKDKVSVRC